MPWVFVQGDREWLFVAEGSAQVNAEVAIVAVPSGATTSRSCTIVGVEATCGLKLVEVRSSVTVTTKGETRTE